MTDQVIYLMQQRVGDAQWQTSVLYNWHGLAASRRMVKGMSKVYLG